MDQFFNKYVSLYCLRFSTLFASLFNTAFKSRFAENDLIYQAGDDVMMTFQIKYSYQL
jgi:hypothetical protein